MTGAIRHATVQVHLGRTCNLSCKHCYSLSGPRETEVLAKNKVIEFLEESWLHGYENAAFSGGEPMIFDAFPEVLARAKQIGFRTSMVTNGTVYSADRWRTISKNLDFYAISIDGPEALHNRIRNSSTAFDRMVKNLPAFRQANIPFGFVHTLTCESLPHLETLAVFASAEGANLLQLHPLGLVGAGRSLETLALDGEHMSRAYLVAHWLGKKFSTEIDIHIDLFNREVVAHRPEIMFVLDAQRPEAARLSDLINPLVLKADGRINPVCHGMHSRFSLGNIHENTVSNIFRSFEAKGYTQFQALCSDLWRELRPRLEWPYFNWYEQLEKASLKTHAAGS